MHDDKLAAVMWMRELVDQIPTAFPYWDEERYVLAAMTAYSNGWRAHGRQMEGTWCSWRDSSITQVLVPNQLGSRIEKLQRSER